MRNQGALLLWWGLTATLLARAASASSSYPPLVERELGLERPPPCTVCHESDSGGLGTVTKPFGQSLQGFGLRAAAPETLGRALRASEDDEWDSDGDGVSDTKELEDGTDPNDGPSRTVLVIPSPENGCAFARSVEGSTRVSISWGAAALTVLGLGLLRRVRSDSGRPSRNLHTRRSPAELPRRNGSAVLPS